MAKKWSEVETSESYISLAPEEKQIAKSQYFDSVIAPQIKSKEDIGIARNQFFGTTETRPDKYLNPQIKNNSFPYSENPLVRNLVDPFLEAGTEVARGYNRGGAAVMTPMALLLKAAQVPEKYNFPENIRKGLDASAESLPETSLDPVSKFIFKSGAELPGQAAAFEQVGVPLASAYKNAAPAFAKFVESKTPKAISDVFSKASRLELFQNFRKAAHSKMGEAVDRYGEALGALEKKFPERSVNVNEPIKDLINASEYDGRVKTFIDGVPGLSKLLKDGKVVADVTKLPLKQVQEIQNYIQGKLPKGVYAGGPHALSPVADFITSLKGAKLESFPELAQANAEYGKVKEAFKAIKGNLSKSALEGFIKNGFNNTEVANAVKTVFGDGSDILKRATNYKTAYKAGKIAGIGAEGIGGIAFLEWLLNRKR